VRPPRSKFKPVENERSDHSDTASCRPQPRDRGDLGERDPDLDGALVGGAPLQLARIRAQVALRTAMTNETRTARDSRVFPVEACDSSDPKAVEPRPRPARRATPGSGARFRFFCEAAGEVRVRGDQRDLPLRRGAATTPVSAECNASISSNGRRSQAASAIHGESSKAESDRRRRTWRDPLRSTRRCSSSAG